MKVFPIGFRDTDIKKILAFCKENKIPIFKVQEEKGVDWGELLGRVMESPVAVKVLDMYERNLERKHKDATFAEEVDYEDVIDIEPEEPEEEVKKSKPAVIESTILCHECGEEIKAGPHCEKCGSTLDDEMPAKVFTEKDMD